MRTFPKFEHITQEQISDMQNQITIHANKSEAKRFARLNRERQQKVTLLLKYRQRIARKQEMDIDTDMCREIITDAQNDLYFWE